MPKNSTAASSGRRRSAAVAAVLSAIVPGAGQWYAGRRRRALFHLLPVVAVVGGVLIGAATVDRVDIVAALVQPRILWMFLGGNLFVAAWRLFAVADAYLLLSPGRGVSTHAVAWLGLLTVVVAVPHVVAGAYGLRSIDVLETVFVADRPSDTTRPPILRPAPEAGLVPDPVTVDRPHSEVVTFEFAAVGLIFEEGVGDPDAIAIRRQLGSAAVSRAPFEDFGERVGTDRVTVLLAGGDAGPGRYGLRTDTMIVATIDVTTGHAALFGLPRNFKLVPLPKPFEHAFDEITSELWEWGPDEDQDGFPDEWVDVDGDEVPDEPEILCHCFPEILNELRSYAEGWTRTYPDSPDPGMEALADTIENLIGLRIDYWMLVDMAGFVRLIDAMGGVEVMVTQPLHVAVSPSEEGLPKARVNVEPGLNHLTGSEALAYVRWRIGQSDYVRMQRQRCLLRSLAGQADPLTMLRSFSAIADAIEESVVTNIPLSFLPDLVRLIGDVQLEEVTTVGLIPPTYSDGRTPGRYPIPDVDRIRAKVARVLEEGPSASGVGESECGI